MIPIGWLIRTYWEGSSKTLYLSLGTLLLAIFCGATFAYPEVRAYQQGPVEVSAADLAADSFDPDWDQLYTVSGSAIYDAGWESGLTDDNASEVIAKHYYGVLEIEDRLVIIASLDPIDPAKTTFSGNIYENFADERAVIEDMVRQAPKLAGRFVSVYLIERDDSDAFWLAVIGVLVTAGVLGFALVGFYRCVQNLGMPTTS